MEVPDIQRQLIHREKIQRAGANYGFDLGSLTSPEKLDVLDAFAQSYDELAEGIHLNVLAAHDDKAPLICRYNTPVSWINGQVVKQLITYGAEDEEDQPSFIQKYTAVKGAVYSTLLMDAAQSSDFGLLISTIVEYKESGLAERFLRDLAKRKQRHPDAIAGNAQMHLLRIDNGNRRVEALKQSAGNYAVAEQKRRRRSELRHQLYDETTGTLGALAIGMRLKFGSSSMRESLEQVISTPIANIAALPPVIEQLIARERKGLPIDRHEIE